jgi:hypothetical protein
MYDEAETNYCQYSQYDYKDNNENTATIIIVVIRLGAIRIEVNEISIETNCVIGKIINLIVALQENGTENIFLLETFLVVPLH